MFSRWLIACSTAGRKHRPFIEPESRSKVNCRAHGGHAPSVTTRRDGPEGRNGFLSRGEWQGVPFPRPTVDIRSPPSAFDEMVDWLEQWSYGLVLLEEYPLSDVRAALAAVEESIRAHRVSVDPWVAPLESAAEDIARGAKLVRSDHEWFATSIEQFWWFFRVVENEDHGGHRQALGQYGRVLAEALRRHRADERRLERQRSLRPDDPVP